MDRVPNPIAKIGHPDEPSILRHALARRGQWRSLEGMLPQASRPKAGARNADALRGVRGKASGRQAAAFLNVLRN